MGEWIVDVISFQKIFGFCGVRGHIVEIRRDVTLVDNEQRKVKVMLDGIRNSCHILSSL